MIIELKSMLIILILGNVICVYRNFSLCSKLAKIIITIRVTAELSLLIYDSVSRFQASDFEEDATHISLSYLFSIICIVLSSYYSKSYVKLIHHLNANHICFKRCIQYSSRISLYLRITIFVWITHGVIGLVMTGHHLTTHYRELNTNVTLPGLSVYEASINTVRFFCSFRFHFEYASIFCILSTMSEQLQCIINSIRYVEHAIMSNVTANFGLKEMKKLDQWLEAYTRIKESSRIINKVYGIQLMAAYFIALVYDVTYYYKAVSVKLLGFISDWSFAFFLIGMNISLLTMFIAAFTAQRLENNCATMKICLNQLLLRLRKSDANYKAVKDFLRLASTQPMATKTFGNVKVAMSLIPAYLAIMTSYTVIALQFNNVL